MLVRTGAALLLVISLSPVSAGAQADPRAFPTHHTRFEWPHGALTGAALAGGIAFYLIGPPTAPRWEDVNALDDAGRAAALGTRASRQTASTISDVGFFGLMAFPIVVDSIVVLGLAHDRWETALHTALISAEVLSVGLLLSMGTSRPVGRRRPFGASCDVDPAYAAACEDPAAQNTSFVSGHALMTFASAGVICAHHTVLRIYGEIAGDVVACGGALAIASAVSVLRLNADRHFLSDVLVGSAAGLLVGWGLPALLHYQPWAVRVSAGAPGADAGVSLRAVF